MNAAIANLALRDKALESPAIADRRGRFLRDLRLSVIDRCNLRCQYCLPAETFGEDFRFRSLNELLSLDELAALASSFVALGVEKIRLTGGEPLLRPRLTELVARLRSAHPHIDLALTTNGLRLKGMVGQLCEAGLDRVNISLDALDSQVAERMAGRAMDPQRVLAAAAAAEEAGLGVKLNAVIKRGVNDGEILPLAKQARSMGVTLRFIEYMDVGATNGWQLKDVVAGAEIRVMLSEIAPLESVAATTPGEVARRYRYADTGLEVGFIESVSAPFCGSCTRARVSAVGEMFTCLFANRGIDLRPLLASPENLPLALRDLWAHRHDRYSELRSGNPHAARPEASPEEMWRLGG